MALLPDQLYGTRLELRRWSREYLGEAFDAIESSYDELGRWLIWAQRPLTPELLEAEFKVRSRLFDEDNGWHYLVVESAGARVVGGVGATNHRDRGNVEIGYWIRSDCASRGYATEAATLLTTSVFHSMAMIDSIEIRMDQANLASAAVARRAGYVLVGDVEREIVTPGHTGHSLVWSMRRSDWSHSR